jgi:hypothetical protein
LSKCGREKIKTRPFKHQVCGARAILTQAVGPIPKEGQEAEVAEDLESLADFVLGVRVLGMKTREVLGVVINIG